MAVKFTTSTKKFNDFDFTLVEFQIENGVVEPNELKQLNPPEVSMKHGVVLSGRGPIWLFGYLIHHYHPCCFVATFDPRIGGGIVIESHVKGVEVGDVIPV